MSDLHDLEIRVTMVTGDICRDLRLAQKLGCTGHDAFPAGLPRRRSSKPRPVRVCNEIPSSQRIMWLFWAFPTRSRLSAGANRGIDVSQPMHAIERQ